jgi:hypothetical protein
MYVIRLPDGTLRVPHGVLTETAGEGTEGIIAHGYVELRPGDPDYDRLLPGSITEQEMEDRRRAWREDDEELLRAFEEYKAATDDQRPG